MQKYIIILLFFLICNVKAQSNFVKAKVTKDNGEELNVKLGLYNWNRVPENIKYKIDENDEVHVIDRNQVSKIEIENGYTFEKVKVDIDKSLLNNQEYDDTQKVTYVSATLFLRLLVEGKASLYDNYNYKRPIYFIKTENGLVSQLINKPYRTDNAKIRYNKGYVYQLKKNVSCGKVSIDDDQFSKKGLTQYFIDYNICVNASFTDYSKKKSPVKSLGLNITFGLEQVQLDYIQNDRRVYSFDSNISPRFGLDLDYHLPINSKNRWVLYFGSSLRFYKSQSDIVDREAFEVKYTFLESTFGTRYLINIFKKGGILIEGGYALQITSQEEIRSATDLPTGLDNKRVFPFLSSGLSLGSGIQFSKNQLSIRYYFPFDVDGSFGFTSKLYTFSFIYSRKIF